MPETLNGATHAEHADSASGAFSYNVRVVTQLLMDWHLPYSEKDEPGWPLNREVLSRQKANEVATSHRILARELEDMRTSSAYYPALERLFLHPEAGYADLQVLREKAEKYGPSSDSYSLLCDVLEGIEVLTIRLLGEDLYCVFPVAWKTNRRESTEEKYLKIAAVFDRHCDELSREHKRYRNKAYALTVDETGESRNTVERAIHYRDNDQNHGQLVKHRARKAKANLRHPKKES